VATALEASASLSNSESLVLNNKYCAVLLTSVTSDVLQQLVTQLQYVTG